MAVMIDTSIVIAVERRGAPPEEAITVAGGEDGALASTTASELLTGVYRADSEARRRRRLAFVEDVFRLIRILPFDLLVTRTHAQVLAQLTMAGQPTGANDLIIAATALAHGYDILTLNLRDIRRVPGLVVRQP